MPTTLPLPKCSLQSHDLCWLTMRESPEEEEKQLDKKGEGYLEQPVPSDDEDDWEGYFLEPVGNSVDIAEKIAEANRKLLEEAEEESEEGGNENRPRKVQFSEELLNFEPNYYSDDDCTPSVENSVISEEDLELKAVQDETEIKNTPLILQDGVDEKIPEEDIPEEISEEIDALDPQVSELVEETPKFILVLLPREQNSSCESIIGEEIHEGKKGIENVGPEPEKTAKAKIARPKSAKKSCDLSKISPDLSCSSAAERKSCQRSRNPLLRQKSKSEDGGEKRNMFIGEIKVQIKERFLKKINVNDLRLNNVSAGENLKRCRGSSPKSCYDGRRNAEGEIRPKTAPMRRTCCVIKMELPHYNGLRSEYGLSAEQLQERKQKSLENKLRRKQDQIKRRQEEVKKRNENEETFQKWLVNKKKKSSRKKSHKLRDTLIRSDVYIQTHASYAANRSVPYCFDYGLCKKIKEKKMEPRGGKKNKTIAVGKLLQNMTPHFKRSFNIYLGVKS